MILYRTHCTPFVLATALALTTTGLPILAQTAPDAGRILQEELNQPLAVPKVSPGLNIQAPGSAPVTPGGPEIGLNDVLIEGNTAFSTDTLKGIIGPLKGQKFDMAGLRNLADAITRHYQASGYPFARTFLPPQALTPGGTLTLQVIEGRYGQVSAGGDPALADAAQGYLSALTPGQLIESNDLERVTLLLNDLPGIDVEPVISPGSQTGTGDLNVNLQHGKRYNARIGLDNHGNYYSGQWRTRAALDINSPFLLGDRLSLNTLYTQEKLWLGQAGYSLPIGYSGLRANAAYSQTAYTLGNGFEGNEGIARITSAGVSYPLIRSQRTNLNFSANWQYKRLYNSYFYGATTERYHATSVPVSLGFDHRDNFAGGGVTWGALTLTRGNLHKNDAIRRGTFSKVNLDLMRLQALPAGLTLFARLSTQWANKNLDSSESMSLGGPSGVRAYPLGESSGDQGWLTQIELRYALGNVSPFVFYDHGRMKINAKPSQVTLPAPDEIRAGAGFGVRYQTTAWQVEGTVAWRTRGGAPTSDTHADPKPRFWVTASYSF